MCWTQRSRGSNASSTCQIVNTIAGGPTATSASTLAVVAPIEARVVQGAIDADPVGLVDASAVAAGRAPRERRRDLDPAILFPRDHPDLFGHLGEVLILAEDHGDVVVAPVGQADHVQRDADVDALLLSNQDGVFG